MGLFDRKQPVPVNTVMPEVAEYDRQLVLLAQEKQQMIFRIGQAYVEDNTSESAAGTVYEEYMKEIEKMTKEAALLERRKLAAQGLLKCEKCGNVLASDSVFCNKCGEKLEPLFADTEKNPRICAKCGTPYAEGAIFCIGCGNKLLDEGVEE